MQFSVARKISFLSLLLVVLTASSIGVVFFVSGTNALVANALTDFSESITDKGAQLESHLGDLRRDALFLSGLPLVQKVVAERKVRQDGGPWVKELENTFLAFLDASHDYMQARFIASDGQEIVRVVRGADGAAVIDRENLQNKSSTPYMKQALTLAHGEVYLSEFNLNREFGKVVEPHLEVIRAAAPVFDDSNGGHIEAVVVLNYEIGHEMAIVHGSVHAEDRSIFVTNDEGDYLLHPDSSKRYGFDLGQRFRVQEDIPALAALFSPDFTEQQLILLPEETRNGDVAVFAKIPFDPFKRERFFTVGFTQPYESIIAQQMSELSHVVWWVIPAVLISLTIIPRFSRRLTRPLHQMSLAANAMAKGRYADIDLPTESRDEIGILAASFNRMSEQVEEAQANLQSLNQNLEQMVEERTQALKDSEAKQRAILETMADGVLTTDHSGQIISVNPAAERIFGYLHKELVGVNLDTIVSKMREEDVGITGHSAGFDQYRLGFRKGGEQFPVELVVSEGVHGEEPIYTAIVRDVTERIRAEKLKNEFVSTVSHELRTPLTSIKGSLDLILGGVVGEMPDQAKAMLHIAGNNTSRLLVIINDILDIQKIESGRMTYNFSLLELMPFIQQAIQVNAAYAEQYNVRFEIAEKVNNVQIYGDKDRLMQVMSNLMSNAAKFSPENDSVEIGASIVEGDKVRVSVTDHGPGIPKDFQPRLFEKFTQADSSDARQKGGSGLGLLISKSIVEKHNGSLNFVTKQDDGTCFYFDLPLEEDFEEDEL